MLSPQALFKVLVNKALSIQEKNPDTFQSDVAVRGGAYGEVCTQPIIRKQYNLIDEGNYAVLQNGQTAAAMTTTAAFSATAPFVSLFNNNPIGGASMYLDYVNLTCTVAGTAASGLTYTGLTVVTDAINRYTSGGTALVANNPNQGAANNAAASVIAFYGAITAAAASAAARTVVGLRNVRPASTGAIATVVGDDIILNFGAVEGNSAGSITVANPSIIPVALPGVEVPPQGSALIYLYYATSTTPVAAQWVPEVGIFFR